jgi:hypothetical protein
MPVPAPVTITTRLSATAVGPFVEITKRVRA